MSIREAINGKPIVGLSLAGLLIFLVFAIVYHYTGRPSEMSRVGTGYFSDDDGQTFYRDSLYNFPPHDHGGKTAVMAVVFSDGQENFVGYLQRLTPAAKKELEDEYAKVQNGSATLSDMNGLIGTPEIRDDGTEIKAPGAGNQWTLRSRSPQIVPKSPNGGTCWMVQP